MGNTCITVITATTPTKPASAITTTTMQQSPSSSSLADKAASEPDHANFRDMLRMIMMRQRAESPPHSVVVASEHSSSSSTSTEENNEAVIGESEHSSYADGLEGLRSRLESLDSSYADADGLEGLRSRLQSIDSHKLYDRIADHLESEELHFEGRREDNVIKLGFSGDNGNYNIFFDIKEEKDCIIVYVMSPVKVPENKRMQACEYITRANYGLVAGNFEMDFRDGEIRFKSSIEFPEGKLSEEMIKLLWVKSISTLDSYFPGMMRVVYSNESAADAIRDIEPRAAEGSSGSPIEATAVRLVSGSSMNVQAEQSGE